MMYPRALFLWCVSVGQVLSAPRSVLHEAPDLPSSWQRVERSVSSDHPVTVHFALKQTNLDNLKDIATSVSDPRSPKYGQFLSRDEIDRLTAPVPSDIVVVEGWLSQAGVPFNRLGSTTVEASFSIASASKLLNTQFHHVSNCVPSCEERAILRADDYWLPSEVHNVVAAIYGLHGLPAPPRESLRSDAAVPAVTPDVITSTYQISGVQVSSSLTNRRAVAEFQGQTTKASDLAKFFKEFDPNAPAADAKVYKFVGDDGKGTEGVEAGLDIEYIMGVAPGIQSEFWYYGGYDFCADLKTWTNKILSDDAAPFVHSVSYGFQGPLDELGCKEANVADIDANFVKLAASGITIIFASGDSGSGYTPSSQTPKLYPSWPASSQWVTSVGATRFIDQKVGEPEMASDQFGSGGGFSTMFTAFKDQVDAVNGYLQIAEDLPPKGSYPPGGRATPDLSALGEGYQVLANGQLESVGGTSASTPAFAAMVSLINEARIKAGKKQMGYLNPFIYQNPGAFTDVTVGTNAIGRGTGPVKYGFKCAKGWDPATGLGTPIFPKLLSAALNVGTDTVVV